MTASSVPCGGKDDSARRTVEAVQRQPPLEPCEQAGRPGVGQPRVEINPLGNLVHVAQGRDVGFVIVDGRIVVEGGRSTLVDEEAIRREGARATRQLWARVQGGA